MAAHRYAIFLSGYTCTIQFIKGANNGNANALSRLSVSESNTINFEVCDSFFINLITLNFKTIANFDICEKTKKDQVLRDVFLRVFSGNWRIKSRELSEDLKPYFHRKDEMAIEQSMSLKGYRLIIPPKFRSELLSELHSTHLGTIKMKTLARSYF